MQPQVQFYILKRCQATQIIGISYFCLDKKFSIIEHKGKALLNQRKELICNCRHRHKFKLMKHKTWELCVKFPCSVFFGAIFRCIWTKYRDLQSNSSSSPRMWRNTDQTNPECEHLSGSWRRTLLRYFNTIVLQIYSDKFPE